MDVMKPFSVMKSVLGIDDTQLVSATGLRLEEIQQIESLGVFSLSNNYATTQLVAFYSDKFRLPPHVLKTCFVRNQYSFAENKLAKPIVEFFSYFIRRV